MQLCASSDGPPWSSSGVVLHKFIADDEICDQQHNTQCVGCFFTFHMIPSHCKQWIEFQCPEHTLCATRRLRRVSFYVPCALTRPREAQFYTTWDIIYRVTWQARDYDQSARHLNFNSVYRQACLSNRQIIIAHQCRCRGHPESSQVPKSRSPNSQPPGSAVRKCLHTQIASGHMSTCHIRPGPDFHLQTSKA